MQNPAAAFELCVRKTRKNIDKIGSNLVEYKETQDGNYFDAPLESTIDFMDTVNWMASFFTGMAALAYEVEQDLVFLRWLNRHKALYEKKVFEYPLQTMHDLGFLYSLFSVALYKLTGDPEHRRTGIKAADELAKRFNVKGSYIRAWGKMNEEFGRGWSIIDCMMNLPLLFWAYEETKNRYYKDIGMAHADMTLRYFIREDHSVYHAYSFDPDSGEPLGGANYCGFGVDSYWARGAAWAIYGFAIAFRYTRKMEYLDAAKSLSHAFIDNLDESLVPAWDFRLPDDQAKTKDTSASAIAICGFMEILKHGEDKRLAEYQDSMLYTLLDPRYLDLNEECSGLLKQSNGKFTYTPFGDYFLMEALAMKRRKVGSYW